MPTRTSLGSIRLYFLLLVAVVTTLAAVALSVGYFREAEYRSLQDRVVRYHLATIRASAGMKEEIFAIDKRVALRGFEAPAENDGARPGTDTGTPQAAISSTAIHVLRQRIREIEALQREFAESQYEQAMLRAKNQYGALLSALQERAENDVAAPNAIRKRVAALFVALSQLQRLHSIAHEEHAAELAEKQRNDVWILFAVLGLSALVGFVLIRRIYRAVDFAIEGQQRAERKLKAHTKELERSNRELQDFAYVASHDLQEPLRKIQAFGDRLNKRYGDSLGEEGRDYLGRMQNAAGRMSALIADLLSFSRVTSKAKPFERVDLDRIAREVLSDLEIRVRETGAHIEIGNLPAIDADRWQMHQLLQNLIGNALKFQREGQAPVVKVGGTLVNGAAAADAMYELRVEDNGIGFEQKYADRIFTIFQRLHGRSGYHGTGIGLAICRKIVERHGGTIMAESAPGEGTSFRAALPVNHPETEKAA